MPVREATEKLCRSCADVGVVVLFVPELPKTHVSGASRWIFERPMIQLSLRYKTDDQLWFTFFHEAAHVLLHARGTYVDEDRGASSADDSREAEANDFAAAALVPPAQLAEFVLANKPFSKAAIRTFASRIGVAPGVVVGQLQHRDDLPRAYCNDLKVRIEDGLIDEFASR
ncbi:MAG: ImmA/IrrE family metallo-endopeptidase, partial [Deltaproteobacteria bacterium]